MSADGRPERVVVAMSGGVDSSLVLAYAAGGLSEMSLVALALHLDIAFVVQCQQLVSKLVRLMAHVARPANAAYNCRTLGQDCPCCRHQK